MSPLVDTRPRGAALALACIAKRIHAAVAAILARLSAFTTYARRVGWLRPYTRGLPPPVLAPDQPEPARTAAQPQASFPVTGDRGPFNRLGLADVDRVELADARDDVQVSEALARLQRGPRSKLLDLRAAPTIGAELFERLAGGWQVRPGTVPRLAIVLGYESWVVFRNVAVRRLRPIVDRGVTVELFYAQQVDSLPVWFADGTVCHEHLPAVIRWLRTEWQPTALSPNVLKATAALVNGHAHRADVPALLLELSGLALSLGGDEGPEQAIAHARAAMLAAGDYPSLARCRALRALALARLARGELVPALALHEMAISVAVVIGDRIEEATAIAEIGFHVLRSGHHARAEARFRTAIGLLRDDEAPYLRATLHHAIAAILHHRLGHGTEAERHAVAALTLRWSPESQLAAADRMLLDRIRARRSDPR